MNISNFSKKITNLVEDNEFLNTKISFGNINKNGVLNSNINENMYNRFKNFIVSRYNIETKNIKIYHLNDMKLYSYDDNIHICIRELPAKYYDFKLNDNNNSNLSFRFICKDQRMIDNINFPSITEYDNIETIEVEYCNIKYKNSEIILEFQNNDGILSIIVKSKIDKYNVNNFLQNFQFIISKLLIKRISFSNEKNESKKNFLKNKHFDNKVY